MKHNKKDLKKLELWLEKVKIQKKTPSEAKYAEACATIKLYATMLQVYEKPLGSHPDGQEAIASQLGEIGKILQEILISLRKQVKGK